MLLQSEALLCSVLRTSLIPRDHFLLLCGPRVCNQDQAVQQNTLIFHRGVARRNAATSYQEVTIRKKGAKETLVRLNVMHARVLRGTVGRIPKYGRPISRVLIKMNRITVNSNKNTDSYPNLNSNPNLNSLSNTPHLNPFKSIDNHTLLPVSLSSSRITSSILIQYVVLQLRCKSSTCPDLLLLNPTESILHTITYSGVMYFRITYSTTDFV